jgi:hypothetical protein
LNRAAGAGIDAAEPAEDTLLPVEERPRKSRTRAVAKFEGTAAPGLRITLDAGSSSGEELRYLWIQTKGPTIDLARPDSSRTVIQIPSDAAELAFTLVVAGAGGIDRTSLNVPLLLHEVPTLPEFEMSADAGDDQIAIIGHQVTLNGARSRPRDGLVYRWIQVEGPKPVAHDAAKWVYTFVPTEAGLYRFLLVVAGGNSISEPDEVRVLVSSSVPAELKRRADAPPSVPVTIGAVTRDGLLRVGAGPGVAGAFATAFEGVAAKMSLYASYEDVFSEISRRLEAILPADAEARAEWDRFVIEPISDQVVTTLRSEGLDLTRPGSDAEPLNEVQKSQLSALFRVVGEGCRDAGGQSATATNPGD